jgi:glycosyltransferase involved in cell wall biosynthesis
LKVALVSAGEIYGGVERFVASYSAYLKTSSLGEPLAILFCEGALARELREAGVNVLIAPAGGRYDPRLVSWLAKNLKSEHVSVLHAHGYKAGVIGGLAARLAGVPAVKTEHGALEPFTGLAAAKMRANLLIDSLLTAWCFEETVYITSDLLSKKRLGGRRGSRVIPNGMAPLDRQRLAARRSNGDFHVGIVGRLSPVKGHDVIIEAMRLVKHQKRIKLDVFGTGPLESDLRRRASGLGAGAVEFHGFVSDVLPAMASLDCLAIPSRHEGLPYTLLEAMHLGLPIVASRVGGMREFLSDGKNALLIEPGDAAALAARLDTLSEDAALAQTLGAAARALARERFGIDAMAEAYAKLYREVVK